MSSFRLSPSFLEQYKDLKPDWGFTDEAGNSLGEVTFLRSYSRLKEDGTKETWAEACQRVVEGMFTIQREHCRQQRLPWDYKKAHRTAQDAYDRLFHFKWTPPGRGMANMGASFVVDEWDGTPLQNCFAGETEFITSEGVRTFKETVGSTVTVLSRGGKWVDAPVRSFGQQRLLRLTVKRQGKTKDIYTTADHRWFASKRPKNTPFTEIHTKDLVEGMTLQSVFGAGVKGSVVPSAFGVARGFAYGDGRRAQGVRSSNTVSLFGEKDFALTPFFEPNTKRVNNAAQVNGIEYSGIPNYFFERPSLSETKSYLYGWLAGYFAADGSVSGGQAILSSANRDDLEFVREVCYILGIGTYGINQDARISNLTHEEHTLYRIQFMNETLEGSFFVADKHRESFVGRTMKKARPAWKVVSVEETDREEEVFCVVVPGTTSFVLTDNIHTGNCAFVSTKTDFSEAMHFLMLASMNGVGVGIDVLGADRHKVKGADDGTVEFVVPDTREGWAEALKIMLDTHLNGAPRPVFDYSLVRPKGAPIKRFGGTASGPEVLEDLLNWIDKLMIERKGEALTVRDIADICNKIGTCVVSGSSRRSAEILVGPQTDEYMDLKNYELNPDRSEWGWMSNNSVLAEVGQEYTEIAQRTVTNGEPGYIWMDTTRGFGRMKDRRDNKDFRAAGFNPCAEQPLESFEMCTLVETYPTRHETVEDYSKTLKVAYLYAKTVTLLPTVFERTNAVMARNRRIGLSQTGISTFVEARGIALWRELCDRGYKEIKRLDEVYSDWLCVRNSIRTTTVKPSGTVSLLTGDSPGVHWNPASGHYIRRVTMGPSVLLDELRRAGYHVEESVYSKDQWIVNFPVKSPFQRSERDVTIWEKVALAAEAQHWWSDNSVSVTVSYDHETEAQYIAPILSLYEGRVKTLSFLPMDRSVYEQMPYEEITEEQYNEMCASLFPLLRDTIYANGEEALGERFCTTDKCEVPVR